MAQVFDRFVHWGFWDEPRRTTTDAADLTHAMERMKALVLSAAELTDGQPVLDCGCGFGGTLRSIDESRRRMSPVGVNIDPRQLAVAAREWPAFHGLEVNSEPRQSGAECLEPFPSATRDEELEVIA